MTCKVEELVNRPPTNVKRRGSWRLIPARYALLYGLLLLAIIGFMFVSATDDLKPREVATTLLGGQIGFLGFLFAIVTFVADTGVLSGSRGVRRLTVSALPYFSIVLLATGATAVCVIVPSELFLRIVVGVALTIATLLPIAIIHLSRKAAPEYVAEEIKKRLAPIFGRRDFDKYAEVIREDLNDLRASAILLWERGDLEGYKTLISAFLASIPPEETRGPGASGSSTLKAERYPQFTFLRMWIEMQGEEPGGLLFMANQVEDEVIERLKNREYRVAAELLGFIVETAGYVLADTTHAEFKVHAFRLIEEVAHKAFHVDGPPPQQVVHQAHMLNDMVEDYLSPADHADGDPVVQHAYEARFALALLLRTWPCGVNDCSHPMCIRDRSSLVADVLMDLYSRGLTITAEISERLANDVFSSTEKVTDTSDLRVKAFGALIPCVDRLHGKGEDRSAMNLLDAATRGMAVDLIDTGSARYVQKCLEVLQQKAGSGAMHNHVAFLRTQYIADSRKPKDLRSHISLLLSIATEKDIDVDTAAHGIESCVRAILALGSQSSRDWLDVLLRLNERNSSQFARRAAIRPRLIDFLNRILRAEGGMVPQSFREEARIVCHLLVAAIKAETNDGQWLRNESLGTVAGYVKDAILHGRLTDENVIDTVSVLATDVAVRLTNAGARVDALKFIDLAVTATEHVLLLEGHEVERRMVRLVTLAQSALRFPRTADRPSEVGIALDTAETVTRIVGGSARDIARTVVLTALWLNRYGIRRLGEDHDAAERLERCLDQCEIRKGDFGDEALVLAARRSLARLLFMKSDSGGTTVVQMTDRLTEIRKMYMGKTFGIADRLGVLEAFELVGRAERELDAKFHAAMFGGAALATASRHLRWNLRDYHRAHPDDLGDLVHLVLRLVEDVSDSIVRIDPEDLMRNATAEVPTGTDPELNTKRVRLLDMALGGLEEFLRLFVSASRASEREAPGQEWLQDVSLDLSRVVGEIFVSFRSLEFAMVKRFGDTWEDWSDRDIQMVRQKFDRLTKVISSISDNKSFDDWVTAPSQSAEAEEPRRIRVPLHLSVTVAARMYEATVKTSTLSNAPRNRRRYLEDRAWPNLNMYINDLLRGVRADDRDPDRVKRREANREWRLKQIEYFDGFELEAMVDAIDLLAETEARITSVRKDPDPSKDAVLERRMRIRRMFESAILMRKLLDVDDGYVWTGINYMKAANGLLRHEVVVDEVLANATDPVVRERAERSKRIIERNLAAIVNFVFGRAANSPRNERSVFRRVLDQELSEEGLTEEQAAEFESTAVELVNNLLRDKSRRGMSSDLRYRLGVIRAVADEGTLVRRLTSDLLRLWNPYYSETSDDGEWLLPGAGHVEWMRA